jgi:cytidine deaminase
MTERLECGQAEALLAELATGGAAGHDRALALQHVATCAACRQALDELMQVADALRLLAPPRSRRPASKVPCWRG